MRFVPTYCLREGMILGDDLYSACGDLMLSRGTALTQEYVGSITRLQFNGVYVDDDLSKNIDIINLISDTVKSQTVKSVRDIFINSEKGYKAVKSDMKEMEGKVENIVDEILAKETIMVNMVDMKVFDDYTYYHSVNVAVLSIVIGVALGMTKRELCDLGLSALMHDIGKVFIKKEILNKAGKLTDEEFEEIKTHSSLGCEHIKKGYSLSTMCYLGILDHHEKYDGGGYPNNVKGRRISLYGRIVAVADVYDALTSDRPYRKALLPSDALEYIMGATMTLFDPKIVEVFVKKIAPYPIGTCVRLSNGLFGIVVENYESLCLRPRLRIYKDQDQEVEHYELDLTDPKNLNITVVEVVER